jgi:hypothetical protein
MSNKASILINDASKNGGKITRARAIELIGHFYYHNGPKYVSEILSRMVWAGKLNRVGRGNYELSKRQIKANAAIPESATNQIKLL